ncbi:Uncharacterised protein [Bordetella pertussis]|nr:Uncharacterised protein [Bordetella pertussis]
MRRSSAPRGAAPRSSASICSAGIDLAMPMKLRGLSSILVSS